VTVTLKINGEEREVDPVPGARLLWVLRDDLKMTGTKFGCGVASCGACTVHVNGTPTRSCVMPIEAVAGAEITTIESADTSPEGTAVQQAWKELDVVQCGYCQSGQIMSAIGLLSTNPKPTDDEIDVYMGGNVCRCATYVRIRSAIHRASEILEG